MKLATGAALCLATSILAVQAQTTTEQILKTRTFREGLIWIGDKEPSETENQELLQVIAHLQQPEWTSDLEHFLKKNPESAWAASLHYDYASFCRRTGRTSKALEQFEAAWNCASKDASPAGQRLSGTILANWTDLLSSLGRLEELKKLTAIGDHWQFINPGDRDKFQGAKHSYLLMQEHPEIAFRCGTFALKAVGGVLQPTNQSLETLVQVPSPTNGFSIAALAELAKSCGLNLMAVRRTTGQDLIIPSIVHWRQNHYAAIIGKQENLYIVSDPTFGREKLLPAEVINEEASGEFLIPADLARTSNWQMLANNDAKQIHGMGLPNNIKDGKDKGCHKPCPICGGMPVWWITEPYINLWIADEPLSYLTSRGEPVALRLTYKERDSRPTPDYLVPNVGWNNSWSSYLRLDSEVPCLSQFGGCMPSLSTSYATVYLADGGEVDFTPGQTYDSETGMTLVPESLGSFVGSSQDGANGLRLIFPDGSQDIYGVPIKVPVPYGDDAQAEFLRSRHIASNGDSTWFQYDAVNLSGYVLTYVVDPDGRTNSLGYTSGNLLSSVTNAYGQTAQFKYDSHGNLTNLVDAQGLSSGITYDTSNNPTALITPYGTNSFVIYQDSTVTSTNGAEGNFGGHNLIDRAVQATDSTGGTSLYLYRYDCSAFLATNFPSTSVPTNTPLGTLDDGSTGSNSLTGVCYRNSFYWGPRQYPSLSTTNMFSFTANDYLRGRMQHWLEDTNQLYLTGFLSVQQDASPDGSTVGLLTFYDYLGKLRGYNFCEGTNARPTVSAWRLPNGETHYDFRQYNGVGNVTNDITTYTLPSGGVGTRTNRLVYANNTYTYTFGEWTGSSIINSVSSTYTIPNLLTKIIGADGNTIWSYGGFDTVTWTNFFYTGTQTNGATLSSSRVLPDLATNGLGQVATATYSSGGNPVTYYDMWPGTSSQTNFNYGTILAISFPGYDKVTGFTSVGGLTTTNIYNASGFLARSIDLQISRTNSFGYTTDGLIGNLTNELGLNLSATWDNLLRLTSVQFPDATYISNTFNRLDLVNRRDRLGKVTSYGHDGARRLTSITNADNAVWQLNWCNCGALSSITDPLTNTTSLNYDQQGNLTNVSFADGSAYNYQYDLAAHRTSIADGAGRILQLGYDNQGLVTSISNTFGQLEASVYDIRNRKMVVTDATKISVTNGFDLLDRVITRTWPDGIAEGFGYSPQGLVFYTNRDNQITRYGHDAAGRLLAVTNNNNEVSQAVYDPAGNVTNLIDGLGHARSWQFNQFGWLTNKSDGLSRTTFRYSYNVNGWITNRFTPEKGNTSYSYDNVGNLTNVTYPQSSISFSYDAVDRLTSMADAVGTTAFTYTPAGQLATESGPWASNIVSYSHSQQLRTALNLTQPSGSWSQNYGYDSIWRLTNIVSSAGAFTYGYDSQRFPLISRLLLPNDGYVTNTYDSLARVSQTALNNYWGHTLDGYSYLYDPLGLRTNITRNLGLTTNSVTATYDNIGQLAGWLAKENNGALRLNEQFGWGYDSAHNVHSRTNGALVQSFNTDAADELTNVTRSGTFTLSGAIPAPATNITVNGQTAQIYGDFTFATTNNILLNGTNTFTVIAQNTYGLAVTNTITPNLPASTSLAFDSNGNLTNDGTRAFAYDSENQLTNVIVPGKWRSDFVYDGLSRRRIVRDYGWTGSAWNQTNELHYVYDGNLLIQERDTNNNPLVTYTRGVDLSGNWWDAGGIGGLLARTDSNGSTFYHGDGVGNITAVMDSRQNIVGRYLYGPFGKPLGQWGTLAAANSMQFSSKPNHNGIYDFGFRSYSPNFGRFLNQDPIQEFGGINLYRFVGNNPVGRVDPLGLDFWQSGSSFVYNGAPLSEMTGSDIAEGVDETVDGVVDSLEGQSTFANWMLYNGQSVAEGFSDLLRFGQGSAEAADANNGWDKSIGITKDVGRGCGLFVLIAGPFAEGAGCPKACPKEVPKANPVSPRVKNFINQSKGALKDIPQNEIDDAINHLKKVADETTDPINKQYQLDRIKALQGQGPPPGPLLPYRRARGG